MLHLVLFILCLVSPRNMESGGCSGGNASCVRRVDRGGAGELAAAMHHCWMQCYWIADTSGLGSEIWNIPTGVRLVVPCYRQSGKCDQFLVLRGAVVWQWRPGVPGTDTWIVWPPCNDGPRPGHSKATIIGENGNIKCDVLHIMCVVCGQLLKDWWKLWWGMCWCL